MQNHQGLYVCERRRNRLAITIMPDRSAQSSRLRQAMGAVLCLLAISAVGLYGASAALAFTPIAWWYVWRWRRQSVRASARRTIGARLSRLPDEFYLLHDLTIPAPWGDTQIDQVIVSRYGLVVIGAGAAEGWMQTRVEAVRTLLFSHGVADGSLPVKPLILLPPGVQTPRRTQYGVPTLRVEHLRLHHLAPNPAAPLTTDQAATIAQCLLQARAVAS